MEFYGTQNINACVGEQDMIIPDVQGGAGILSYNWYVDGVAGTDTLLIVQMFQICLH